MSAECASQPTSFGARTKFVTILDNQSSSIRIEYSVVASSLKFPLRQADQVTSTDLERKFFEEFGRAMTPEEKRLLLWAEKVSPATSPKTTQTKDDKIA